MTATPITARSVGRHNASVDELGRRALVGTRLLLLVFRSPRAHRLTWAPGQTDHQDPHQREHPRARQLPGCPLVNMNTITVTAASATVAVINMRSTFWRRCVPVGVVTGTPAVGGPAIFGFIR